LDVGGTVVFGGRGAYATALAIIEEANGALSTAARTAIARLILTGLELDEAVEGLAVTFRVDADVRRRLYSELGNLTVGAPEPEAEAFVSFAREQGWAVYFVTNVARWADGLPAELAALAKGQIRSSEVGWTKADPRYWKHVETCLGIDPARSLVVGDNEQADYRTPRSCGFPAARLNGRNPLRSIASLLAEAGASPTGDAYVYSGGWATWGTECIIDAPHLGRLVERVTRCRIRLYNRGAREGGWLIRRSGRPPAIVCEHHERLGPLGWVTTAARRRATQPQGLRRELLRHGVSIDGLTEEQQRHIISLYREAKDEKVRALRTQEIVAYLDASTTRIGA
jgi:FMN phosphatase YigB (HAD superfamily)